jgi:hypothetical protein
MNRDSLPLLLCAGVVLGLPCLARAAERGPDAGTFFAAKIRPVLVSSCLRCHGAKKPRGQLRLDSRAALLRGGAHGPAVVAGEPKKSLLVAAIRHTHDEIKMPPDKQLAPEVVSDFVAWIKGGAVWPRESALGSGSSEHWAFAPIRKVEPPADPEGWSDNPIDRFLRAKQRQHSLTPAGPADRRTLIRRATFDLTGLPPTPEEVDAFLADRSPDAWPRLVDRLLASPACGERWGRHWLDVARYADSGGFEADHYYPSAWKYREYVIHSINADKPIDRFLQEQVAGDELWPEDREAVIATAMYCVGPALAESAMISQQLEYEWLTDAADTTGAAFLGMTIGCARCHDHKYDPISQKDYFALQAIFAGSDRPFPAKVRLLRIKALNGLLSDAPVPKKLENDPRCTLQTEVKAGFRLFHRAAPLEIRRLARGELSKPLEVVAPAFPAALESGGRRSVFSGIPATRRRSVLARWLTARDNPLTARVLVNRVWSWHFGQGIVRTPSDFGAQGEPPSHPELLDWLANDFMGAGESGVLAPGENWSLKRLHRLIMLSRTYQMESRIPVGSNAPALKVDPRNHLLWHFPRRRLEGEAIRDHLLACAGTLNRQLSGPPVVPPLGREELTGLFDSRGKWPITKDRSQHTRRSAYLLQRRTFIYPLFSAFDPPEVMTSCQQRIATTVPTQALALLNSPLVREQALAFARRLLRECSDRHPAIVARAWCLAFGREVSREEEERALAFLKKRMAGRDDSSTLEAAVAELCLALFNANEFVYVD